MMRNYPAGKAAVLALTVTCLALSGSQPALAQVKLQYKFPEGKTLTYKTSTNSFQLLTFFGMEIQSGERKTVVWAQAIGKRRGDASLPIAVKVQSLHIDWRLQGGINFSYDSSKPGVQIKDRDFAPLGQVSELESQAAYTVVLDRQDKVQAVEGTETLQQKAGQLDPISQEMVRPHVDPDRLKAQFQQDHQNLPEAPARPGESWERTETLDFTAGQAFVFRKKYEYLGTETKAGKTLDKIGCKVVDVNHKQDPNSPSPLKVTKSSLKVESSEGTILFDREAGCVVEARERTKLKGNMTFSGGGTDTASPIELTLQSNTQLQSAGK
jgi:hypothetical protein